MILATGSEKPVGYSSKPAFDPYRGAQLKPGPDVNVDDDAELDEWIKATGETLYHPVGTCKMGSDPMAVTNEHGQVHGVQGLRVVDASLMPTLIAGNTNAPTIMLAEKSRIIFWVRRRCRRRQLWQRPKHDKTQLETRLFHRTWSD